MNKNDMPQVQFGVTSGINTREGLNQSTFDRELFDVHTFDVHINAFELPIAKQIIADYENDYYYEILLIHNERAYPSIKITQFFFTNQLFDGNIIDVLYEVSEDTDQAILHKNHRNALIKSIALLRISTLSRYNIILNKSIDREEEII